MSDTTSMCTGSTNPPPAILQFFGYAHLPEDLQAISRPFGELAQRIVVTTDPGAEQSVALRKLLESKDAAVRALLTTAPREEGALPAEHAGTSGMPMYRSHKIVRGAPIVDHDEGSPPVVVRLPNDRTLEIAVPDGFFARVGDGDGHLVEYEPDGDGLGGYLSWSPSEAFEGGYARIEGGTG